MVSEQGFAIRLSHHWRSYTSWLTLEEAKDLLKGIFLGDFQCDLLDQLNTFQQGDLCGWNARKCKKLFIKAEVIESVTIAQFKSELRSEIKKEMSTVFRRSRTCNWNKAI